MTPGTVVCHACSISTATAAPDLLVGTESGRISLYSRLFRRRKIPNIQSCEFRPQTGEQSLQDTRFRKPDRKDKGPQYAQRPITETAGTIGGIPDGRRYQSRNSLPRPWASYCPAKSLTSRRSREINLSRESIFILTEKKFARKNPLLTWPTATTTYGIPPRCRTGTAS